MEAVGQVVLTCAGLLIPLQSVRRAASISNSNGGTASPAQDAILHHNATPVDVRRRIPFSSRN